MGEVLKWTGWAGVWAKGNWWTGLDKKVLGFISYLDFRVVFGPFGLLNHKDQKCKYPKHEGPNLPFSKLCFKDQFCQVNTSQGSILHFSIFSNSRGLKL